MRLATLLKITPALVLGILLSACQTARSPSSGSASSTPASSAGEVQSAAKRPQPAPAPSTPAATASSPSTPGATSPESPAAAKTGNGPAAEPKLPKITYSPAHDKEIKEILHLAGAGRWEEAQAKIDDLYRRDPHDPAVQRLHEWVGIEGNRIRSQALENKIRSIDANNSVFNPTPWKLLTESKDRGLPPRKDVRKAIQQIEAQPYIPSTYGKTNVEKGPLYGLSTPQGHMDKLLDKPVTLHLQQITLSKVIFQLGASTGINFVADKTIPAFKQTLTVNLDQVPLREFLGYLSRNFGLQFQVGADLIWITDAKDKSKAMESTRFYRLSKSLILPAEFGPTHTTRVTQTKKDGTQVVTENENVEKFVNDSTAIKPSIETAISKFFTGKYMIDYGRSLIVARGTPEQLHIMDQIVKAFDQPLQQVLIEARFITVSRAAFMELGASWETGRSALAGARTPQDYTGLTKNFSDNGLPDLGLGLQTTFTHILNRRDLTATITALEQSGESQTLSAPRLTLVNNLPGTISDGLMQYYYDQYTVQQQVTDLSVSSSLVPSGNPTNITAGVTLNVLATIGGDGQTILLALNPQVNSGVRLVNFATVTDRNSSGQVVSTFDIKLPESTTQSLATRVRVESGQTVVLGGVIERNQTTYVESIPGLGNLPIIGALFRKRTEVDSPRYLLIFVTANILSNSGEFVHYQQDSGTRP